MKYTTIALPDDFEKGDCERCPFSYLDYDIDGDPYDDCVFEWYREPCKLEVKEFVPVADIVDEVFGQMRDATEQEQKSVSDFVERISKTTGVSFYEEEE